MKNIEILCCHDSKRIVGARGVDGSFENHPFSDGEDVLLLNSFDGAEAFCSKDNLSSVISFSSHSFKTNHIKENEKAGSSFNMFTWLHVIGKESISVMKFVGTKYFKKILVKTIHMKW